MAATLSYHCLTGAIPNLNPSMSLVSLDATAWAWNYTKKIKRIPGIRFVAIPLTGNDSHGDRDAVPRRGSAGRRCTVWPGRVRPGAVRV